MTNRFETFTAPLKDTHFSLCDFVDFRKVEENVEMIAIYLNLLNYLLGKQDMRDAVRRLWDVNKDCFSVLDILIAVRKKDHKKVIDAAGNTVMLSDYFKSPELVTDFLDQTGLTEIFVSGRITNLVDYVFGIEVGLDTNARKNRGGHIMEKIVAKILRDNKIEFEQEVYSSEFPDIVNVLGVDSKRFDFVIRTPEKIYLIETNFYSSGGSKLNEVARSYSDIAPKINSIAGFEFVWITDGIGWNSAKNKLEEAFLHIPRIYNLSTLQDFIDLIK